MAGEAEEEVAEEEEEEEVAEAEVAEAEAEVAAEEEAVALVVVPRRPCCNPRRWHQRWSDQRRCHQCRSNQCLGHQGGYQTLRRRPLTTGGRQHCRCRVLDLHNLHRPLVRQLGRCRLFQTDPPRRGPAHRRQHRQGCSPPPQPCYCQWAKSLVEI